jgi:hypothetical protein
MLVRQYWEQSRFAHHKMSLVLEDPGLLKISCELRYETVRLGEADSDDSMFLGLRCRTKPVVSLGFEETK